MRKENMWEDKGKMMVFEEQTIINNLLKEYEFNERFLQIIWNEQYLSRGLKTTEGKKLEIISPGRWNNSAGPDFLNGKIRVDGDIRTGNIEIHRRSGDWYRHGHNTDNNYSGVILHAVWEADRAIPSKTMETLEMRKYIPDEWRRLLWEMEESKYSYGRKIQRGGCSMRWTISDDDSLMQLIESAGTARYKWKTGRIKTRMEEVGIEKGMLEFLFGALGYKNNSMQFRQLCGLLDFRLLKSDKVSEIEKEAHIFGTANMLPDITRENVLKENMEYVQMLWDSWWKNGAGESVSIEWNKAGCRPYNTPWRRVAGAIELLKRVKWNPWEWLKKNAELQMEPEGLLKEIYRLNQHESKWRTYLDFGKKARAGADLIGRKRLLDITVNSLLPALNGAGILENRAELCKLAEETYKSMPAGESNSLIKEAASRFLSPPGRIKDLIKKACHQQGILEIYTKFCLGLNKDCSKCPFFSQ